MTEALQEGLDRLKQRREDLKAAIAAKKREAARLQKKRSQALQHQLRSVRSRLSSQERKLRTRRLIVLGGLMEKEGPPEDLLSKLDRSLDRDQDRALFGLPPKAPAGGDRTATAASAPLEGWRPGPSPGWLLGGALRGASSKGPAPGNSSASPSPSGPEAVNPGKRPLPKSSSGPPTASWFAPEDSTREPSLRTATATC